MGYSLLSLDFLDNIGSLLNKSDSPREFNNSLESDSSSAEEDDDNFVSFEEQNNEVNNGCMNESGLNIMTNQYEDRNNTPDVVDEASVRRNNEVDSTNNEAEMAVSQPRTDIFLPLNTNITENPDVWALASNIGEYRFETIAFFKQAASLVDKRDFP